MPHAATKIRSVLAAFSLATLVLSAPAIAAQVSIANSVVFSSTGYINSVNSTFTPGSPDYGGNAGRVAINSRGDVIFTDAPNSYNGGAADAFTVVTPANGGQGSEYEIVIHLGYNSHGVVVDSKNNVYVGDTNSGIYYIPFIANAYPATPFDATAGGNPACSFPLSGNTVACSVPLDGTATGGYIQVEDMALDSNGNIFVMDKYDANSSGAFNRVVEFPANGSASIVAQDGIVPQDQNATIAVDSTDGIYYASPGYSTTSVSYFPAGSSTPVSYGSGLIKVEGVALDKAGNLYIVDAATSNSNVSESKIVEIPNYSGIDTSNQYTLINFAGQSQYGNPVIAQVGPGIDDKGNVYYVGVFGNSINSVSVNSNNLFDSNVGTASNSSTLNVAFNSAVALTGFNFTGPFALAATQPSTGACAAGSIAAGSSCQVNVVFSASSVGKQIGEITANNNPTLGAGLLTGVGEGGLLNVDPGTVTALGTGYTAPAGVAVDLAGNAYITDTTLGKVFKVAAGGTTATIAAAGLSSPTAIAIDGASNLYVAGDGEVAELPWSGSAYGSPVTLVSGLSGKTGLAVDGTGDLFVADSGNSRVLLVPGIQSQPYGADFSTVIGSGYSSPVALAVDTNSDLYISDAGTNSVYELNLNTGTQTTVVNGLSSAAGIAVDPTGVLFVTDAGAKTITKESSPTIVIAQAVAKPGAIAVDNAGNVYAIDTADATAGKVNRSAGSLNFGSVDVGSTSGTLTATVSNGGTNSLAFNNPYYTQSSSSLGFDVLDSTTCAASGSLSAGATCTLSADWTPVSSGAVTDSLTFSSNAINAPALALTGTGSAGAAATTSTFSYSPDPVSIGQTLTLKVTVASASGTPTGSATFYANNYDLETVALSNGVATVTVPTSELPSGTYSIKVDYLGNSSYAASTTTGSVVLNAATSTTTFAPTPNPAQLGQTVALKATVTASAGTPTGTVTFSIDGSTIGSATVTSGVASLTVPTAGLPTGTYAVVATYSGNSTIKGSSQTTNIVLQAAKSTVVVSGSPNPVTPGTTLTLKATVSGIDGTPTGTVTFYFGTLNLGSATLSGGAGSITLPTTGLPAGSYTITADYGGSSTYTTGSGSTSISVK